MLSHYDHYTPFPGKDAEVQKEEVMGKGHMGGKRQMLDLTPEPMVLTLHCTLDMEGLFCFFFFS